MLISNKLHSFRNFDRQIYGKYRYSVRQNRMSTPSMKLVPA